MRKRMVFIIIMSLAIPSGILGLQVEAAPAVDAVTLNGSGASFPAILINKWSEQFYEATGELVTVNYGSGGSGKGVADTKAFAVDFAGSDAPFDTDDKSEAKGTVLHIPETMGAVVVTYNIPSFTETIVLDGETIAEIFQTNITKWNDPAISALNPDMSLPENDIVVAHRSDSSGTTFAFSDYLDRASDKWVLGTSKTIDWPADTQGGEKNDGVAAVVSQTDYSVGYVEFGYAKTNSNLQVANLKNKAGFIVSPTVDAVSAAAASAAATLPAGDGKWDDVSIANLDGENVWPISTFTYILVYEDLTAADTNLGKDGAALIAWLKFMLSADAQVETEPLGYAPLPQAAIAKGLETVETITFDTSISPDDYWNPSPVAPGFEVGILLLGLVFVTIIARKRKN